MTLGDLGESGLIARIRSRNSLAPGEVGAPKEGLVRIGIGDDAAVFEFPPGQSAVFCSDLVVENTHFLRDIHPADSVAYKAVASNVSDVGAMGGLPLYFLLSFAAPASLELAWLDAFIEGLARACSDFDVSLLGGDSSSSDRIFIDVSMIGRVPGGKAVRRSGARAGDSIYVTGQLGSSALGLELIRSGNRNRPAIQRHLYPEPRHRVGHAVVEDARAMIDISDGLSTDLSHILEESRVSARIYKDRLPAAPGTGDNHVLHGGEEYELIIVASELPGTIENVPLTRIGEIIDSAQDHQIFLIDGTRESVLLPHGWQHFQR